MYLEGQLIKSRQVIEALDLAMEVLASISYCTLFRFLIFLNPNEHFCAMVLPRLQKEAGRLVMTHEADPRPQPLTQKE